MKLKIKVVDSRKGKKVDQSTRKVNQSTRMLKSQAKHQKIDVARPRDEIGHPADEGLKVGRKLVARVLHEVQFSPGRPP